MNVRRIGLVAAAVVLSACTTLAPAPPPNASSNAADFQPNVLYGENSTALGFDACSAPSASNMLAWTHSPYRTIGIYIGGKAYACRPSNLTPQWLDTVGHYGWKFLPIWVGYQAPCVTNGGVPGSQRMSIDWTNKIPGAQGTQEAADAVNVAAALGMGAVAQRIPIYYDMEAYGRDPDCINAVLQFTKAWTDELHAYGYSSGFYSSGASGIADQVQFHDNPGYTPPDELWYAHWNNQPCSNSAVYGDRYVPDDEWVHHRHRQWCGGHNEAWGGVTINIDNDSSDGTVVRWPVQPRSSLPPQTKPASP